MPRRVANYTATHWQGVLISVLVFILFATIARQVVLDQQERSDRQEQFCNAVPLAAEAGAQAVVDIAVKQAVARGDKAAEVERIRAFGKPIRFRAREIVLSELPFCR